MKNKVNQYDYRGKSPFDKPKRPSLEDIGQILERNFEGRTAAAPLIAKEVSPKKKKAQLKLTRSPKDMYDISRKVHGSSRLLSTHYIGEAEIEGQSYDQYEREGVQYFNSLRFLDATDTTSTLVKRRPPKVSVSQSKNVLLLLNFTQQQQFNRHCGFVRGSVARFNTQNG